MRTESVRVLSHDRSMTQPMMSELLMREEQRRVRQATARDWQVQYHHGARIGSVRTAMGRVLIRAGQRLTPVEVTFPPPNHLLTS